MNDVTLPNGWAHATIDDLVGICGVFRDGDWVESKDQDPNGKVRLIQLADIGDGEFRDKSARFLTSEKAAELNCTFLENGDALVARMPDPLGRACLFPLHGNKKFVTVVDICIIRFGHNFVNEKYFMYALNSPMSRRNISDHQTGSTRKRISRGNLSTVQFPIAPLPEQHRIVVKIEELFSELDKGIENLKTAQAQIKVYRQALLKHAFEGKLTTNGGVWCEKTLGELLGFLTSGSRGWAQYYTPAGDLFIRAQNIKHDYLELDDIAFVSLPDKTEGLRTRIQQGDLLITITGANVTKAALVKHDLGTAYVSQHVALCRPTVEILPEFFYWFVVAEAAGRKQLTEMAYGAGKPGLNLENIRSVKISLPSLSEQQKVIALIEDRLSEADQLDQTITTSLQQAEALRQSILKKAFSGQLVPQDPHDEPASDLLARIKAERATTEKNSAVRQRGKRGKSAGRK